MQIHFQFNSILYVSSTVPTVVFHPCFQHYIQTTAAVFYLTSAGRSARSSLYSRQAGISSFWCHRLERPASPRRICAVTRGFQTTTQDISVFPFLPRHYHLTRVLLSPFITTVWTPVVLAKIKSHLGHVKNVYDDDDDDNDDDSADRPTWTRSVSM